MTSKIHFKDEYEVKHAVCNICKGATRDNVKFNYINDTSGFICKNCLDKFPKKDIELMHQLFIKYGGYFNKHKNNKNTLEDIIRKMMTKLSSRKITEKVIDYNEKALYRALIHGFIPKDFFNKLKSLNALLLYLQMI